MPDLVQTLRETAMTEMQLQDRCDEPNVLLGL